MQVTQIEQQVFGNSAWDTKSFLAEKEENPYASMYVYEVNQKVVGYVDLWIAYENAEIANIAVEPTNQHKGIASQLMTYCLEKIREENCENVSLEVRVSNIHAITLYKKFQFHIISTRKHYYEDGEDAYLMVLNRRLV